MPDKGIVLFKSLPGFFLMAYPIHRFTCVSVCVCLCMQKRNRNNEVIKVKGKFLAVFSYPKNGYIKDGARLISEVESNHMNTNRYKLQQGKPQQI